MRDPSTILQYNILILKRTFLAILSIPIVLIAQATSAQINPDNFQLPATFPSAPNAAALGRYGEIPVSINTGVPNISVPIYTIQSGDLSLPISISYHGSGIKVGDKASSVGLGWVLNTGGGITRVVHGLPDEGIGYYAHNGFSKLIFPDARDPILFEKDKCLAARITDVFPYRKYDGQPDLFYYNINGKSGMFLYKNRIVKGLDPGFMTSPYAPIKIRLNSKAFYITDENGITYVFGADACDSTTSIDYHATEVGPVTSAWHITSIISADKSDTIILRYQKIHDTYDHSPSPARLELTTPETNPYGNQFGYLLYPSEGENALRQRERLISEIDFRNGRILFNYDTASALQSINVVSKSGDYVKTIRLFHSYYLGIVAGQPNQPMSLRLDSIQEVGTFNDDTLKKPPYVFSYYTGGSSIHYEAPPYASYGQDFWGYFNGRTYNDNLLMVTSPVPHDQLGTDQPLTTAYKRMPDSIYMRLGTLHKIQYPTGGSSIFDFEPNMTTGASPIMTGGLRIRKIISDDGKGDKKIKIFKYPGWYYNSDLFYGDTGNLALNNFKFEKWKAIGDKERSSTCDPGRTGITYLEHFPISLGGAENNAISYSQVEVLQQGGEGDYLGKEVYSYNVINDISTPSMPLFKISKEYERQLLLSKKTYKYHNGEYQLVEQVKNSYVNINTLLHLHEDTCRFYTVAALLNMYNTVYDASGPPDYYHETGSFACPIYYKKDRYRIDKAYYTSSNICLDSTISTYYTANSQLNDTIVYNYESTRYPRPSRILESTSNNTKRKTEIHYVVDYPVTPCIDNTIEGFMLRLDSIKAANFSASLPLYSKYITYSVFSPNETGTGGFHGFPCYPLEIDSIMDAQDAFTALQASYDTFTDSSSPLLVAYRNAVSNHNACIYQSFDTASSAEKAIMIMQQQNDISPILNTRFYEDEKLLSTKEYIYNSFYPNTTKPQKLQYAIYSQPLENRLSYDRYNQNGRLLQTTKINDMSLSFIWGYRDSYKIAYATNSTYDNIAYSSFEADGKGNWSYSGTSSSANGSVTGNKAYDLSSGSLTKSGLTSSRNYIISYWLKLGGSVNISGGTQSNNITGATVNGWTYHEKTITGVTTITLSGSGYIDELRLYPSDAQMVTYTYEPLIGITSQCDARGYITYYSYDGFGRLTEIRDYNDHILKRHCYSYSGEQSHCQIYYNTVASKSFRCQCSGGDIGSIVNYVVSAGTYSSDISQEDAQAQAQADIDANGQNYANAHGSCSVPDMLDVNYVNSSSNLVNISLTNTATQQTYSFPLSVTGSSTQVAGQIPEGFYNVTFSPTGSGTALYTYNINVYYESGVHSATIDNVELLYSGSAHINISNY